MLCSFWDRFWIDLGTILEVKNAFKIDQKSFQKVIEKKMQDKIDFWWILGGFWGHLGVKMGPRGVQEGSKMGPRGPNKKIATPLLRGLGVLRGQELVKGGSWTILGRLEGVLGRFWAILGGS